MGNPRRGPVPSTSCIDAHFRLSVTCAGFFADNRRRVRLLPGKNAGETAGGRSNTAAPDCILAIAVPIAERTWYFASRHSGQTRPAAFPCDPDAIQFCRPIQAMAPVGPSSTASIVYNKMWLVP